MPVTPALLESRFNANLTFTPCRHGTGWTGQPSISDRVSISNAKYLSLLQWYLIAKPASSTMEHFI
jgi:hypothetical protein